MNEDPINEETLPESSGTDSEPVLGVTVNSDGSRRRFSEVENRVRRKKSKQKFQKVFFRVQLPLVICSLGIHSFDHYGQLNGQKRC